MSRHTIGDKRGSVRGAPPDVYLPFFSASGDEEDTLQPIIWYFGLLLKGLIIYLVVIVILWLFFGE